MLKRVKAREAELSTESEEEDPFSSMVQQSKVAVGQEKFIILRQIGRGGFSTVCGFFLPPFPGALVLYDFDFFL